MIRTMGGLESAIEMGRPFDTTLMIIAVGPDGVEFPQLADRVLHHGVMRIFRTECQTASVHCCQQQAHLVAFALIPRWT